MSHYVVTTSAHHDRLRGDSPDDCFCTRGVAEHRFDACTLAGHEMVRLVQWDEGLPVEIVQKTAGQHIPHVVRFCDEQSAVPALGIAAYRWLLGKLAATDRHQPSAR